MTEAPLTVSPPKRTRSRYNWDLLKLEFLQGPFQTMAEFRRFKGVSLTNVAFSNNTAGWLKEKHQLALKAAKKAAGELVSHKASEIKKVINRHASLGRYMQLKGAEALKTLQPKTVEDARKLVQTGIETERDALGFNEKGGTGSNLTQVNVNVPKTRFDEILDAGEFEDLLRLAADVRRERTRRTGEGNIVEGEIKAQ